MHVICVFSCTVTPRALGGKNLNTLPRARPPEKNRVAPEKNEETRRQTKCGGLPLIPKEPRTEAMIPALGDC
jgi:hypothetical protein